MINSKNVTLVVFILFSTALYAENSESSQSEHIKPDCSSMVDSNANPLEQLLDYIYKRGASYSLWVQTPNRGVSVVQVSSEKGKVTYLRFEIPYRIDMDSKYSHEIYKAVDTRQELLFAAYRFVRNVDRKETFNIQVRDEVVSNARPVDAGKYGYMMCWNLNEKNNKNCLCATMAEFAEWIKYHKPNETSQEQEQRFKALRTDRESKSKKE